MFNRRMFVFEARLKELPLLISVLLNGAFFTLYLCFGEWRFGSLDDFFMSSVLVGAYGGQYDVHLYFINAIYGYILKPLYTMFPSVGWYSLGEAFEVFASFVAIVYCILISARGWWRLILSLLVLGCVEPVFWPNIGFTQCAAVLSAAGVVLAGQSILQNKKRLMIIAVMFLVAGYVMRSQMFLLSLPTLALTILLCLIKTRKVCWKHFSILMVGLVAIVGLHYFDRSLYKTDGYDQYAAYQGPRAYFGDGGFYDMESAYDEMMERGLCGYDLRMLRAWYFYDKDAFSLDSLRHKIEIVSRNRYDVNYLKLPVVTLIAISKSFGGGIAWCWLVLSLIVIFGTESRIRHLPWLSFALLALCYCYMLMVNRVAGHVESGAWLCAIIFLLTFCGEIEYEKSRRNTVLVAVAYIITIVCFSIRVYASISTLVSQGPVVTQVQLDKWKQFETYVKNHPDDAFILSFEDYKMFATAYTLPHESIEPGSWDNIFTMGYWNIYLPAMEKELSKRGVVNPIKDVVLDNVYTIDSREPMLPTFFEKHYGQRLVADTVEVFDDVPLLKYRLEVADEKR